MKNPVIEIYDFVYLLSRRFDWGFIGVSSGFARIVGTCLVFISSEQSIGKTIFLDTLLNLTMHFGRKIIKFQKELFGNFPNVMKFNILLAISDSESKTLRDNY